MKRGRLISRGQCLNKHFAFNGCVLGIGFHVDLKIATWVVLGTVVVQSFTR